MPDEAREKLDALEEEWKDKIRETEIELSLERAKIARERAELQQAQHQLQKDQEKLGVDISTSTKETSEPAEDDPGTNRWLKFLKRGNDSEDDE